MITSKDTHQARRRSWIQPHIRPMPDHAYKHETTWSSIIWSSHDSYRNQPVYCAILMT